MNYIVIKALNNLANGNTTFNTTVSGVAAAIANINPQFDTGLQNTLTAIEGAFNGWTNNLTTLGDGAFATAFPNITGTTPIGFTRAPGWAYIFANTQIPAPTSLTGDVSVSGSDKGS